LFHDWVVPDFYFAFVEMDQNEDVVITVCGAYLLMQEGNNRNERK
jgi:hypothetical protein